MKKRNNIKSELELFFSMLFPNIKGYIEVRGFKVGHEKPVFRKFFKTVMELLEYELPNDLNLYFGVFERKNTRSGASYNCSRTNALWVDIDHVDITELDSRLRNSKLPKPSIIVNSGNGYHCYWLLDAPATYVKSVLVKIVVEIGGDSRPVDTARILRIPETYNFEEKEHKHCKIVMIKDSKYSINYFKELLGVTEELKDERRDIVNLEKFKVDRYCISQMLKGVKKDYRNFSEGRLISYFKQQGYTKIETKEIIDTWNLRNKPPEKRNKLLYDFERYWFGRYKLLGCQINDINLQGILSNFCNKYECEFLEHLDIQKLNIENTVEYNNRIFNNFKNLSGYEIIVFGVLLRHREGLNTVQLKDKLRNMNKDKLCMSLKILYRTLKKLEKLDLIEKREGKRRIGGSNFYRVILQGTFGLGYTLLSNGAINGAIDRRVTPDQLKIYLLLLKFAFKKGKCFPSQLTLSKEVGTTINYISKTIKQLEHVDYLKRYPFYTVKKVKKMYLKLLV
ncbi:MAG: helix-turn-helix domain-containing protein [Candidatus Cloacimonetes bacterium]|nr:helix-turn-helix domain-containing protein [Candidatus Cloacimonadota bacterium]